MSREEEVKQFVRSVADDSAEKAYEISQWAEVLGRFRASFSSVVNGTNDISAKEVCDSFLGAQKELNKAAKAYAETAKAGYDWCGDNQKTLVFKKVR